MSSKMTLKQFKSKIKFSKKEYRDFLLIILITGFALGFNDGHKTFNATLWLTNLFQCFIAITIALFLNIIVQKLTAVHHGYVATFSAWTYGLIGSIIFTLLSIGKLIVLMPFGTVVQHNEKLRLGKFRYGIMHSDIARISLNGIFANVFFALFLRLIFPSLDFQFINNLVRANAYLAIYTILPIPPLNGFHIFFNDKLLYFFWAGFVISLSALIITSTNVLPLLIYGVLGGGITVSIYYFLFEK